jgi:hypothetical protein
MKIHLSKKKGDHDWKGEDPKHVIRVESGDPFH